jgi:hypothetical protein
MANRRSVRCAPFVGDAEREPGGAEVDILWVASAPRGQRGPLEAMASSSRGWCGSFRRGWTMCEFSMSRLASGWDFRVGANARGNSVLLDVLELSLEK